MIKKKAETLSVEAFLPFGRYVDLVNPAGPCFGTAPIEYYRDMVQADFGNETLPSFSVCRCGAREKVVDVTEYHSTACEGALALDGDVLIHVMPATPAGTPPPVDEMRIFRVPQGTLCITRPGVWHHAPFVLGKDTVNVLIILPERIYANDSVCVTLEKSQQVNIED